MDECECMIKIKNMKLFYDNGVFTPIKEDAEFFTEDTARKELYLLLDQYPQLSMLHFEIVKEVITLQTIPITTGRDSFSVGG